jgi:hypothetical protein
MAQKKKASQKVDPYVTRAQLAGLTRYGGQESALVALLKEAQDRRDQGVASAKSTARGTVSVIERAQPQLQQVYKDAGFTGAPAPEVQLPSGPATFSSAQAFEQAGAQRSIARQAAAAIGGLQSRRRWRRRAGSSGRMQAQRTFDSDRGKIADQAVSLADQKGNYQAGVLLDLVDKGNDRKSAATQKQLDRDQRVLDRTSREGIAADNRTAANARATATAAAKAEGERRSSAGRCEEGDR